MKKFISILLLISFIFCASCGKKTDYNDLPADSSDTETTVAVTETSATESGDESRIAELENRLNKLEEFFGLEYKDGSYSFINGSFPFIVSDDDEEDEPHEEYDDTAVVNAYLTHDDSALTDEKDKELLTLASGVLKETIKDGMTEYEKELAVHDWLITNVKYDDEELAAIPAASKYSHMPYGALKYKRAICVGYATTLRLFLNMLGIENKLVHMTLNGEHAWVLVKLGDDWYHADATFDATDGVNLSHEYFNITEEAVLKCGYFVNGGEFPVADGIEFNYFYINGKQVGTIYDLPSAAAEWYHAGYKAEYGIILDGTVSPDTLDETLETISQKLVPENMVIIAVTPCYGNGKTVTALKLVYREEDDDDDSGDDDDGDDDSGDDDVDDLVPDVTRQYDDIDFEVLKNSINAVR